MTTDTKRLSVDELQQAIVDVEEGIRALEWARVDVVAGVMDMLVASGASKRRAASIAGSAAQRREHWALLCHRLHHTFPDELRFPHVDLFVYRTALSANDPVTALLLAADEQWSAKDLLTWIDQDRGKDRGTSIHVTGHMTWTGGDMVITPDTYDAMVLGEGLEQVAVKAVITTRE